MINIEKVNDTFVWFFIGVVAIIFLIGCFGLGGYGMMGFGFIFMLLFWGLIIWLIVALINSSQSNKNEQDSLTILKKRYASGEITKKQYEEMKKELRGFE